MLVCGVCVNWCMECVNLWLCMGCASNKCEYLSLMCDWCE